MASTSRPPDHVDVLARALRAMLNDELDSITRRVVQLECQLAGLQRVVGMLLGDEAVAVQDVRRCLAHAVSRKQRLPEPGHQAG